MRYLLLAVLGVSLLTAGLFFPWGDKQVVRADCQSVFLPNEVRSSQTCDILQIDALYWSDHVTIDLRTWETTDGEAEDDPHWTREFHDYEMTGEKFDGNAGLFWGRPILWFSVGAMALAMAGLLITRQREDIVRQTALWALIGAVAFVALGATMGLGGMVLHSATWKGTFVTRLEPRPGGLLAAAGAGFAIFGSLRYHASEMMRLAGVGGSPLAPIHAWDVEQPEETAKVEQAPLHWGRTTWVALAATAFALMTIFTPVAQKEITLVECDLRSGRGWVCEEDHLDVRYGLGKATVITRHDDGLSQDVRSYDGTFQDLYGGSAWMRAGSLMGIVGLAALASSAGLQLRRERKAPRWSRLAPRIALAVFLLAMTAAVSGIVHQSWTWAGSPAGHLRPATGAYLAALAGIAALMVVWMTRKRRDNSA